MVLRFEVGRTYYSVDSVWGKDGKVVKKKRYWLCVKRNDRTRYVSFQAIVDGVPISSVESRKSEVYDPRRYGFEGETCERVSIGYGGSGSWRNYHIINASNIKR